MTEWSRSGAIVEEEADFEVATTIGGGNRRIFLSVGRGEDFHGKFGGF